MSKKGLFGGFFGGSKKNLLVVPPDPPPKKSDSPTRPDGSIPPKLSKLRAKPRPRPGDEHGTTEQASTAAAPAFAPRALSRDGKSPNAQSLSTGESPCIAGDQHPQSNEPRIAARSSDALTDFGSNPAPTRGSSVLNRIQGLDSMRQPGAAPATALLSKGGPSQPETSSGRRHPFSQQTGVDNAPGSSFKSSLMKNMMASSVAKPLPESMYEIVNDKPARDVQRDEEVARIQALEIVVKDDVSEVSSLSNASADYPQSRSMKSPSPIHSASVDITSAAADNDTNYRGAPMFTRTSTRESAGLRNSTPLRRSASDELASASKSPLNSSKKLSPMRNLDSNQTSETRAKQPAKRPSPASVRQAPPPEKFVTDNGKQSIDSPAPPISTRIDSAKSFLAAVNSSRNINETSSALVASAPPPDAAASPLRPGSFLAALPTTVPDTTETLIAPQENDCVDEFKSPSDAHDEIKQSKTSGISTEIKTGGDVEISHKRNMSVNTTTDTLSYNVSFDDDGVGDEDGNDINDKMNPEKGEQTRIRKSSTDESLEEMWPWLKGAMGSKAEGQNQAARAPSQGELTVSSSSPRSPLSSMSLRGNDVSNVSVFSASPRGANISIKHFDFSQVSSSPKVAKSEEYSESGFKRNKELHECKTIQPQEPKADIHDDTLEKSISIDPIESQDGALLVDTNDVDEVESPSGFTIDKVLETEAPETIDTCMTKASVDGDSGDMLRSISQGLEKSIVQASTVEPSGNESLAVLTERMPDIPLPIVVTVDEVEAASDAPSKSIDHISAAMKRNDDIFSNLLLMIDGKYSAVNAGLAPAQPVNMSASVIDSNFQESLYAQGTSRNATSEVPHYQEVKSSYNRAMKPTTSELDVAYRRAMGGVNKIKEHERMMKSINELTAVLEEKKPSDDVNALLAPNWNLQLHLRNSLAAEKFADVPSLEQSERIADTARSFVSVADGQSRERWNNDKAKAELILDKESAAGIYVPPSIEEYCRPFTHSLADRLHDEDVDRLVFSSAHDPLHATNSSHAMQERYMKDIGEKKLNESVEAVRKTLASSVVLLEAALPTKQFNEALLDDGREADVKLSFDEVHPVLNTSVRKDNGLSNDFVMSGLLAHDSKPTEMDEISDLITKAVMSAAKTMAVDDEYFYEEDQETYQSVRERELRFDGREYKFNNLVQFTVSEAETSMDKSRALFDMCDSDIDQLFNLGRSVAESGTHETYLNTLLKSSYRSSSASSEGNKRPSPSRTMPLATKSIDAEINLSPFFDISVDVNPKINNGKYVFDVTSAPLATVRSKNTHRNKLTEENVPRNRSPEGTNERRKFSRRNHDSRVDCDEISQYSVRSRRSVKSSASKSNWFLEHDEQRRWQKPVEYSRAGSPGRVSSDRDIQDELLSPFRRSRSDSPAPSYMSPYYYAGHVISNVSHHK